MDSKLPHEMNIEILSRTSLKTFDTIVSTNKEFHELTYDPYFLRLYKQRNNIVSGFIVQPVARLSYFREFAPSQESTDLDLGFLSRDARILATSEQGIMVFETRHRTCRGLVRYHVCKPATKQVAALPNPKTHYLTEKVAIVVVGSQPLHYKILRLSQRHNKYSSPRQGKLYTAYCCEIFDSATLAWKLLDDIMLPDCVFLTTSQPINIAGSIYTLLTNNSVLKFDIYSDKWTTFPLRVPDDPFNDLKLVKYEGMLALARKPWNGGWEIWIGTMNESWEKKYVLKEKEDRCREGTSVDLNSFYDSDTSVVVDHDTLEFYDFKKGGSISKIRLSRYALADHIFAFRSDFEPVELRDLITASPRKYPFSTLENLRNHVLHHQRNQQAQIWSVFSPSRQAKKQHSIRFFAYKPSNGLHEFAPSNDSADLDLGFLSPDDRILATPEKGIIVFESPHPRHHGREFYYVCKPETDHVF
ncbi:uncharacterized protein LOC112504267 [Cynara cardunculus var. scolymus]|uniref:uncharacterized protein LOC112504267 n=1 Tax=Cynara cardunculus var. scolymus TaxID=59895 RepID=UPI000D62BB81|nr:uncharacterized protein LOC112504267 [Cynara cardunculus var. scolymus]